MGNYARPKSRTWSVAMAKEQQIRPDAKPSKRPISFPLPKDKHRPDRRALIKRRPQLNR